MIAYVIDTSALVELATAGTPDPVLTRRARAGNAAAPELIDVEALQVLRGMHRRGRLDATQAELAAGRVVAAPVTRITHRPLLHRVWELRDVLTAYDAVFVALAERLGVPLLTCDGRLGRAHGHRARVEIYP